MLVAVNMCSTSRHQLESRSHRGSRVHTRATTVVRHTSDGTASLAGSLKQCFLLGKKLEQQLPPSSHSRQWLL